MQKINDMKTEELKTLLDDTNAELMIARTKANSGNTHTNIHMLKWKIGVLKTIMKG
jgi:ribosomal protein L29